MDTSIIQITSGRGPAECCLAVALTVKKIKEEAKKLGLDCEILDRALGPINGTLVSALLRLKGKGAQAFCKTWTGTIMWVSPSPYRTMHRRKNWFIGIELLEQQANTSWDEKDLKFQTLRASGPGGQHVNKVETAVRAIHLPTGLSVLAADSRSQMQNKKEAIERLKKLFEMAETKQLAQGRKDQWQQHNELQRGNPVRTFMGFNS